MSNSSPVNNSSDSIRPVRQDSRDTRPQGSPKSDKDFNKVLNRQRQQSHDKDDDVEDVGDSDKESGDDESSSLTADNSVMKGKRPISLFDLSGAKQAPLKKLTSDSDQSALYGETDLSEVPADTENSTLASASILTPRKDDTTNVGMNRSAKSLDEDKGISNTKDSATSTVKEGKSKALDPNADALSAVSGRNREGGREGSMGSDMGSSDSSMGEGKNKDKIATRFATEQPDLSSINPATAANQNIAAVADVKGEKVQPTTNIQEIINQMVNAVQEMKTNDKSDTIITLKQPPLFAGATLVVTTFASAQGEFNISFQGLTQTAKNLLDMSANQTSLKLALEEKGYAVHIITTTTEIENVIVADTSKPDNQRDRENPQQQQDRQNKNRKG